MTLRLRHIGNAGLDQTLGLFSFASCPKMQREQAALFQPKNAELKSGFVLNCVQKDMSFWHKRCMSENSFFLKKNCYSPY